MRIAALRKHLASLPLVWLLSLSFTVPTLAQDDPAIEPDASESATDDADKTGTNPINFQRDLRLYNEHTWLNTEGDGDQNLTTLEFRTPFADDKWQFRMRTRYNVIDADLNGDGSDDADEQGLGDTDIRFLTVPFLKGANAMAFALELFFDTASEDELGSGTTSIGPQAFYVRFFGGGVGPYKGGGLFAPGLQYKYSLDESSGRSDTDQIVIDLNLLMMAENKSYWFFTDPQIVIDRENDIEFSIIDVEFGWMMARWFPEMKGHSFYIRPAFYIGADRPGNYGVELGYKVVGW